MTLIQPHVDKHSHFTMFYLNHFANGHTILGNKRKKIKMSQAAPLTEISNQVQVLFQVFFQKPIV